MERLRATTLVLAVLAVLAVLGGASARAMAQEPPEPSPAVTPPQHPALSSIRTEADVATALYITSSVFLVASVPIGIAAASGSAPFYRSPFAPPASDVGNGGEVLGVIAWTCLGLGLVGMGFAIALDVDAGSRYGGLHRAGLVLRFGPASVGLDGRF